MLFIILTTTLLAVARAEDIQSEITSNTIIQTSSTEKNIELREFIDKALIIRPSNLSQKSRRSRYLRQAPRPRRRPPYDYQVPRRPNHNYPNLYGPRNRFKSNEARFRPGPPRSRYQYHRDNWRQKWPDNNSPYYEEEDMDTEGPIDEYDDIDEYKNDDAYYSKKYRDTYDDAMSVSTKYNEKRSPHRYVDTPRQKARHHYDAIDFQKESPGWQERNRFSNHYRDYVEMMANAKQYADEHSTVGHRFRYNRPNQFRLLEEDEFDFSAAPSSKNRRFKIERQPAFQFRRPSTEQTPYEDDFADVSKYLTTIRNSLPKKQTTPNGVYSAKYHGHEPAKVEEEKAEMKIDETRSRDEPSNVVHEWKRNQRQQNADFYNQFIASNKAQLEYDKSTEGSSAKGRSYKDDRLLPGELIAYMSVDPADAAGALGKEERYLHSAFPFIEKFTDHDILKSTYLRNISPSDRNTEIIFDERAGDWKH